MEPEKIRIDMTLLSCIVQSLGRIPETMYDFQKVKKLSCGGEPVKLIDPYNEPLPDRLEIAEGDFGMIGKMSRLKKLTISAMPIQDFSFLKTCIGLEELEISGCGVIDCAILEEVKSLKSLSLHYCSGLEHPERLLKLFRLKRLSLEGTRIEDAGCFMHCWIPEVHLPAYILKEEKKEEQKEEKEEEQKEEKKEKAISRKNSGTVSCREGVPFRKRSREQGVHPYTTVDQDSPFWEIYRGAYGSVREYIVILTGERDRAPETFKLRRLETAVKTNYELAFDNLLENLYHQMSFYRASWLVLPYLARLMEGWEKEKDREWLFRGIMAAGSILATDVYGEKPEDDLYVSYRNAILQIRDITISFLAECMDYVLEKDIGLRREFAVSVLAVLGEEKLAFMLFLSGFESCYIVCPSCENCDEEIEFGYCEPSEKIKMAKEPLKRWDGESLKDVKQWVFNLFDLIGDSEGKEKLCYYFGTYVCPECGEKVPVLKGMEEYYG